MSPNPQVDHLCRGRVPVDDLRAFVTRVLIETGVPEHDAFVIADTLVQADLWGHPSHGVLRLPWYLARLRSGVMTTRSESEILIDSGPLLLLDGKDGIGQMLTDHARAEAVDRARRHGIGAVGIRNSNHFGTAMHYTRRAAKDGCVSLLTTNASPAMAPWGGRKKILGTNPWSMAAPWATRSSPSTSRTPPSPAERSTSPGNATSRSPTPGRLVSPDGARTTDPHQAVYGVILPMAGHKGYAITFMMDVLAGALTGSKTGTGVHGPYEADKRSGCGHFMIAIDVATPGSIEEFNATVGALVGEVKNAPLAHGFNEIFYPGELEDRAEQANLAAGGISLPAQTWNDLTAVAANTGFP